MGLTCFSLFYGFQWLRKVVYKYFAFSLRGREEEVVFNADIHGGYRAFVGDLYVVDA